MIRFFRNTRHIKVGVILYSNMDELKPYQIELILEVIRRLEEKQ